MSASRQTIKAAAVRLNRWNTPIVYQYSVDPMRWKRPTHRVGALAVKSSERL